MGHWGRADPRRRPLRWWERIARWFAPAQPLSAAGEGGADVPRAEPPSRATARSEGPEDAPTSYVSAGLPRGFPQRPYAWPRASTVDDWKVDVGAKIGKGGFGHVHQAEATQPDGARRTVAVKILQDGPDGTVDPRFAMDLRREVALQQAFPAHPALVRAHGITQVDGRPAAVFDRVEGQTVHGLAREQNLTLRQVGELTRSVASALGVTHKTVVHGDIKPSNIMVDATGQPKVMDWGSAQLVNPERHTETINGTWYYTAPEKLAGHDSDPRSDTFSLGLMALRLATGTKLPSEALTTKGSPEEWDRWVQNAADHAGLPGEFTGAIRQMVASDPSERPDPHSVAQLFDRFVEQRAHEPGLADRMALTREREGGTVVAPEDDVRERPTVAVAPAIPLPAPTRSTIVAPAATDTTPTVEAFDLFDVSAEARRTRPDDPTTYTLIEPEQRQRPPPQDDLAVDLEDVTAATAIDLFDEAADTEASVELVAREAPEAPERAEGDVLVVAATGRDGDPTASWVGDPDAPTSDRPRLWAGQAGRRSADVEPDIG